MSGFSLRQTDSPAQVTEARVGLYTVPERVYREIGDACGMLVVALLQQPKGSIFVAETSINGSKLIQIDVSVRREIL
jgi:hypothetical protein